MECPFCTPDQLPPTGCKGTILEETEFFRILVDNHPLTEGHILIVPKQHLPCIGAYDDALLDVFKHELARCTAIIEGRYGKTAWFEHGVLGQTISHSHVHIVPFAGDIHDLIPEGDDMVSLVEDIADLRWLYEAQGGYLVVSINNQIHIIDEELAEPRFFRNRFAKAYSAEHRSDWRSEKSDEAHEEERQEVERVRNLWNS